MTRVTDRRALTCTAVLLSAAMSHAARAQSAAPTTRAESLFAQGKQALEANDFAHACPLLQESYGIDPALGTLLALAVCHEGVGRTATAWREFRTAADGAAREGRTDRERFAQAHITKLEAHLSKLTVAVSSDSPPGLVVEVDGTALPVDQWGTEQVIDPGHHVIAAHAPRRQPWSGAADIGPEHDAQTVTVGALVPDASDAVASPPPASDVTQAPAPDASTPGTWKRPAGWIVGGAGLAAVGVGAVFGVMAITKSSDAKSKCSQSSCTDSAAVSENQDAKTSATIADVAIGAGLVAVAVGAWFLFTAPPASSATSALPITPFVGREQAGIALIRAW